MKLEEGNRYWSMSSTSLSQAHPSNERTYLAVPNDDLAISGGYPLYQRATLLPTDTRVS